MPQIGLSEKVGVFRRFFFIEEARAMKNERENALKLLESNTLEMMQTAVAKAYLDALSSGNSVLVSKNGVINEVFPDGTVKLVKRISPPIRVAKGKIIKI